MSTDYAIGCRPCGVYVHLCVRMAGVVRLGHGGSASDLDDPYKRTPLEFVVEHDECPGALIVGSDESPEFDGLRAGDD